MKLFLAVGMLLGAVFVSDHGNACTATAQCAEGKTVTCTGYDLIHSSAGLIHPARCWGTHGEFVSCINWNGTNPQTKYCPGTEFGKPVVPR